MGIRPALFPRRLVRLLILYIAHHIARSLTGRSIDALLDCFFYDYSMAPLWVQENYLACNTHARTPLETLQRMRQAADAIADGDLVRLYAAPHVIDVDGPAYLREHAIQRPPAAGRLHVHPVGPAFCDARPEPICCSRTLLFSRR
jgi:hypothetical protein